MSRLQQCVLAVSLAIGSTGVSAVPFFWTDWQSEGQVRQGFQGLGTITTGTSSVTVTYTNPQGIAFYQTGAGIDYFTPRIPPNFDTSPYTSALVDNIPTAAEMIALQFAGTQTLQFSEAIANPVFAFVSLNGNGYAFDQDFEILSLAGVDGNACGYWGCGDAQKVFEGGKYKLNSTSGEPHGVIRFLGTFSTLTWDSQSNENWNGFTLGVQGTAVEVCATNPNLPGCIPTGDIPEPGTLALLGLGVAGLLGLRRK